MYGRDAESMSFSQFCELKIAIACRVFERNSEMYCILIEFHYFSFIFSWIARVTEQLGIECTAQLRKLRPSSEFMYTCRFDNVTLAQTIIKRSAAFPAQMNIVLYLSFCIARQSSLWFTVSVRFFFFLFIRLPVVHQLLVGIFLWQVHSRTKRVFRAQCSTARLGVLDTSTLLQGFVIDALSSMFFVFLFCCCTSKCALRTAESSANV